MSSIPEIPAEPVHPASWPEHPRKKMLMSPMMLTIGGLMAFATVVFMVVVLPVATFEPEPSPNWRPLTAQELEGRDLFLANGCIYCHSGFSRPQDVFVGQYYVYPRVSEPGDFVGEGESPNLFGTVRTGPDLSQSGGFHPDDWHYAHYYNPRYTTPDSVMPQFKFMSEEQMQALIAFTQSRGGKAADIRSQHQENMKVLILAEFVTQSEKAPTDAPQPYEVQNLAMIDRGYWFEDNPLPVTQQNLMRGRQIFEEQCIGCHGIEGNGDGPAAPFLNPRPFAFTNGTNQAHDADKSPGAYYWRILRGIPGTAMENFGTRLSVEDIWSVVLFLKTIANGGLTAEVPTPEMYIQWVGTEEAFTWANCFLSDAAQFQATPGTTQQLSSESPPEGVGDGVPNIVAEGAVNPVYAVSLWMVENKAVPCASEGFENVTFAQIVQEAEGRGGGYARQGTDQYQFIPEGEVPTSQIPPALLETVWNQEE